MKSVLMPQPHFCDLCEQPSRLFRHTECEKAIRSYERAEAASGGGGRKVYDRLMRKFDKLKEANQ